MLANLQDIASLSLVALAAGFILSRVARSLRAKSHGTCASCGPGCSASAAAPASSLPRELPLVSLDIPPAEK